MLYETYFDTLERLLKQLRSSQGPAIAAAARLIADSISAEGIVHVFGSGHSFMLGVEVFHRAGGLMPVQALLDPNLTHFGLINASMLERTEGYGRLVLDSYDLRAGEVLIVVSNSGINPVPTEVAIEARRRGMTVIAVTSAATYADAASRHSSGVKLVDVVDLILDTQVPRGDAIVPLSDQEGSVGAASTVLGAALMNAVMVEAAALLAQAGQAVPVIVSMNLPEGDAHNRELFAHYKSRLRLLQS